jgi:hypothetical protein
MKTAAGAPFWEVMTRARDLGLGTVCPANRQALVGASWLRLLRRC